MVKMATKHGVYIQPPSGSREHAMRPQINIAVPSAEVADKSHVLQGKVFVSLHIGLACNRTFDCRITCDAPVALPVNAARLHLYNHLKSAPHLRPSVDSARTTETRDVAIVLSDGCE